MLNKYLLKEGRPSRPKKVFQITALVSLLIILVSTGSYFLAAYMPAFREPINNFRVTFQILLNQYDLAGIDALKILINVPVSCIGALVGGINLIRITNRKGFLSVLHVLPVLGIIIFIIGACFYFLVPSYVFNNLPVDYSTNIPYFGYVGGALVWVGGIVIADIFAFFYPFMNYTQFLPVYKEYHRALRHAKNGAQRSRIRHYFYYFWKKKRYDDMLGLLFIEKTGGEVEAMDIDSYVYFRNGALEHMSEEKAKQLDELYETEQYDILGRELAMLSGEKEVKPALLTPDAPSGKKPDAAPEEPLDLGPETIEIDDREEVLTRHGKHLARKGRNRAMAQMRRERAKEMRAYRRAEKRAKRAR